MGNLAPRLIAFYLPQYYPIPENDSWWGKGFTEWRNVVQANPLFPGHYQPRIPADLGYYDLRLPEIRNAQADLAREYGIHGFCYYHYWFDGKRLLERPFNEVLSSGEPDFPFCLCWANESWTRTWDGRSDNYLIVQQYSEEDDRRHIRWLSRALKDPRYIHFNNKPIFLIYRASSLPNPAKTAEIWREEAIKLGIGELYLCMVQGFFEEFVNPRSLGFDGAVEFQPSWRDLGEPIRRSLKWRIARRLGLSNKVFRDQMIFDYRDQLEKAIKREMPNYPVFRSLIPSWDNSARRNRGAVILKDSSPGLYEYWLKEIIKQRKKAGYEEDLVFINAWNEWAEGCHLEPDLRNGRAYLEATYRALATYDDE